MKFDPSIKSIYRDAIEEAVSVIIEKGNPGHVETAKCIRDSDVNISFVPLAEINCSGITGLVNAKATNRRIRAETLDLTEALSEAYIKFSDWTYDVAGQRGCQGTIVHEGLHACDFARIISTYSNADAEPLELFDLTLYELEHRAAVASGEYLVLIGKEDYIDDGLKLNLVSIGADGKPFVDLEGIKIRMQNGYGLNENEQGTLISNMIGVKQKDETFSLSGLFGFGR